jgi:hypothetical protein
MDFALFDEHGKEVGDSPLFATVLGATAKKYGLTSGAFWTHTDDDGNGNFSIIKKNGSIAITGLANGTFSRTVSVVSGDVITFTANYLVYQMFSNVTVSAARKHFSTSVALPQFSRRITQPYRLARLSLRQTRAASRSAMAARHGRVSDTSFLHHPT